MKYLLVLLLGLSLSGCYIAPYDRYYANYPAYGGYYGPAYYTPAPAVVSVGYGGGYYRGRGGYYHGGGGYYGHRYWR